MVKNGGDLPAPIAHVSPRQQIELGEATEHFVADSIQPDAERSTDARNPCENDVRRP